MTQKTALIFDLDGTLVHSAPDMQVAVNAALEPLGRGPLDLATIISFVGNGVEVLIRRSLMATGGTDDDTHKATLYRFLTVYEANGVALTRPYPGVLQQLEHLAAAGVTLGLCTNKPTGPARHICEVLGLSPFLSSIIGAMPDQPKKPDPTSLRKCLDALGQSPTQALYVGDSAIDYATAQAAGVDFCLFTKGYLNADIPTDGPVLRFDDWSDLNLFPV
ncbi:phosphoglycolate phosphatase [Roseobacter sp. MH60115]|uniref:phosphoglycolate phosphatase n=1 Tax=Roseobacter sp. MH60115 TaxID=2785324 RepID=UPI0018A29ED8|nr:phosphoglycolate phosphatase [Roseobacter sp. MH60115]